MKVETITVLATAHENVNVLILWNKILEAAENSIEYRDKLNKWLSNEESTVFLRDELCSCFKGDSEFQVIYAWDKIWSNTWTPLDTFSANIYNAACRLKAIHDFLNHYTDESIIECAVNKREAEIARVDILALKDVEESIDVTYVDMNDELASTEVFVFVEIKITTDLAIFND